MRHSLLLALLLACPLASLYAQDVQTNNRGIIVNQIVVAPAYPVKTSADYLQDYENGRAASEARGAAAADEYLRAADNRARAKWAREAVGKTINDPMVFEVKDRPFVLHSSTSFTAWDDLEWTIPLGTRFRLLTLPGLGGILRIQLLNLNLRVPASSNGFTHTPGLIDTGYVQVADFRREPGQ